MSDKVTVLVIAQELGIKGLTENGLIGVAKDAETYVTGFLELAERIRKHKFRKTLTVDDINESLISRDVEPLVGYHSNRNNVYKEIGKYDGTEILTTEDKQIPLDNFNYETLTKYPEDTNFEFHWLAKDGIQPKIEQNQKYFYFLIPVKKHMILYLMPIY